VDDRWRIERGRLGGEPALAVAAPPGAAWDPGAARGATLLAWRVRRQGAGTAFDLTDGYRGGAELHAQDGVRNGILAPFPNRVADARYRFAGRDHDLLPGTPPPRLVYHGFARSLPFHLIATHTTATQARLTLRCTAIRPGAHPGYPFALDLTVTWLIRADGIEAELHARNVGDDPAPYAAGWHPYFRLPGRLDDWTLHVPASTLVRTDANLIPYPGASAYAKLDGVPHLDFRAARPLGATVIDACYADLAPVTDLDARPDAKARIETVLRSPATGDELRVWQHTGLMHVFTGDTLARSRRAAIALEPVEAMTNAYNRPDCAAALLLDPGAERTFRFGVDYLTGIQ
jgi:aldose 1-epimerase